MKKLDPAVQAHLEEMHRSYCDYNQKPPADRNGAGTVFASHLHRVVVLRWGNHENLKNIVGLAKKHWPK